MEEEVEAEAEVEGNVEKLGAGRPRERAVRAAGE